MIEPTSVVRTTLSNGLTVLVRRDASAPVVAIVTYVNAGYFDETDDVGGIAHVLEHMYFKGTPNRGVGEIAKQTKAAGGFLNASTIYDHTSYYTVLPSSSFAEGLEVQADAYANSLIDTDELRRELEVIIQEAKRKADNPSAVATETLYEVLHDSHRIRRWRIGREPGLRALSRNALVAFYRNFYHPGNTILSIVGDVDPDATLRSVERLYGGLASGSPVRIPGPSEVGSAGFRYREWTGDIGQTQLALGWRTAGTLHPDTPALDIVAATLGTGRASRLYRAVRERQLASSISAYNYTPTELGVFVMHAESTPDTASAAGKAVWDQLRRVRDGDLGALEVERAQRIYETRWARRLEGMEGQATYLAEWQSLGDWRLGDRYLERILATTVDDATRVAADWLSPANASVVVYRPTGSVAVAQDAPTMLALLDAGTVEPLAASAPRVIGPPPAGTSDRPRPERVMGLVRVYRTPKGIPVLVRLKPGAPLVHIGAFARGGACHEPAARAGLTLLMARAAVKGTRSRTALQIAEDAEMLGGSVSAATGSESFGWSISVPTDRASAAMELLADVVQHPTFSADALEIERAAALADVIAMRDDMGRYPTQLALQTAFAGHPYGVPAAGTEESLHAISSDELGSWHAARVTRGPMVLAIVGDGDPDDLAALAIRALDDLQFGEAPALPPAQWPSEVLVRAESRDRAQTALTLLLPGPSRSDDDRFAADLIGGVASGLGGRFFEELRDRRSLCYTVNVALADRALGGTFVTYIATSPDQESAAREALLAEFDKFRAAPVTREELSRAQMYAIGVHQIGRQSGGAVLGEMVDAWLFGDLDELTAYEDRVRSVTVEQMQRVAQRFFDPARRVEGIVRGHGRVV